MTTVEIKLPDSVAQEAKKAGLLDEPVVERVFREALRKQAVGELFAALDEIQALKLPPMSEEEIQAEIDAVRVERRRRAGG